MKNDIEDNEMKSGNKMKTSDDKLIESPYISELDPRSEQRAKSKEILARKNKMKGRGSIPKKLK